MDGYALRSSDTAAAPVSLAIAGSRRRRQSGLPTARAGRGDGDLDRRRRAGRRGRRRTARAHAAERMERSRSSKPVPAGAHVRGSGRRRDRGRQSSSSAARGWARHRSARSPRQASPRCSVRSVRGSESSSPARSCASPATTLGPGQIYESNGLMLAAQLASAGAVPAQLGVVPDDEEEHRKTMERALLGFDMLVTSGGASVGPHDLVRGCRRTSGSTRCSGAWP